MEKEVKVYLFKHCINFKSGWKRETSIWICFLAIYRKLYLVQIFGSNMTYRNIVRKEVHRLGCKLLIMFIQKSILNYFVCSFALLRS